MTAGESVFSSMRLIVTSGPTREWLDPVRFLTNSSSGKTGHGLARAGMDRFAEVILISGPGDPRYSEVTGARTVRVESTGDLLEAVMGALGDDTLLVMSAAPADYTPVVTAESKIKKDRDGSGELVLRLQPTPDILAATRERAAELRNCVRVGFAAETDQLAAHAREKLRRKGLDFICANEVYRGDRGFGENPNTWFVFGARGEEATLGPAPKEHLAEQLFDFLATTHGRQE